MLDGQAMPNASDFWKSALKSREPSHRSNEDRPRPQSMAWQIWDEEIEAMNRFLRSAKASRNTVAPGILQFPPEITSLIFFFSSILNPPKRTESGWFKVTHVCKQWRQIALKDAKLWSQLDERILSRKWFRACSARSARSSTALSVSVKLKEYQVLPDYIKLPLQASSGHRLRHLTLFLNKPSVPDVREGSIMHLLEAGKKRGPAPLLESLTIELPVSSQLLMQLPKHFLTTNAPRLRILTLQGVSIHWDSSLLRNLVHLSITLVGRQRSMIAGYTPSKHQLLALLSRCAHLETLTLVHVLRNLGPGEENVEPAKDSRIPLPSLTSVHLKAPIMDVAFLMKRLIFSPTARLSLFHSSSDTQLPPLSHLGAGVTPIRALRVDGTGGATSCRLSCWGTRQDWQPLNSMHDDGPEFTLSIRSAVLLSNAPALHPLDQLMDVCIHAGDMSRASGSEWPVATWRTIFAGAPQVRRVTVSGPPAPGLLRALSADEDGVGANVAPLLFPLLETLIIRQFEFYQGGEDGMHRDPGGRDFPDGSATTLLNCLQSRGRRGCSIRAIEISRGNDAAPWLDSLMALVPSVEFGPCSNRHVLASL